MYLLASAAVVAAAACFGPLAVAAAAVLSAAGWSPLLAGMAVADGGGEGGRADGSAFAADPCAGTAAPAVPFVGLLSSSAVAAVAGRSRQRYSCPGATRCHGGGVAGSAAGPDRRRCHRRWAPSTTRCPTLRGDGEGPTPTAAQRFRRTRGLQHATRARRNGHAWRTPKSSAARPSPMTSKNLGLPSPLPLFPF